MGLNWGGIATVGGDLPDHDREAVRALLDKFADEVDRLLNDMKIPRVASPIFRPFGLVAAWDSEKLTAVFARSSGMSTQYWLDSRGQIIPPDELVREAIEQLAIEPTAVITLPTPVDPSMEQINAAAVHHVAEVGRSRALSRLGDLRGLEHLEPALREFLDDHPDPQKNVFVMMRFLQSAQMSQIHTAVNDALRRLDFRAVRADDRDYTGELWTNIQVCMAGCQLGLAVFEDIEQRDFNPNVSLELGYMLARQRRCLILKEKHLPALPADVMHRLYKPFDMFNIHETISHQIERWLKIDLRLVS